jgi:hypothetical protein
LHYFLGKRDATEASNTCRRALWPANDTRTESCYLFFDWLIRETFCFYKNRKFYTVIYLAKLEQKRPLLIDKKKNKLPHSSGCQETDSGAFSASQHLA